MDHCQCVGSYAKPFAGMKSSKPYEAGPFIRPILQMRKLQGLMIPSWLLSKLSGKDGTQPKGKRLDRHSPNPSFLTNDVCSWAEAHLYHLTC